MKTITFKILVGLIILTFVLSACAAPATEVTTTAPTEPPVVETAEPVVEPTTAPVDQIRHPRGMRFRI